MEDVLKVIIVDDEYLIRNLIKMKVDWEKAGMRVVGEAGNAEQAMELVEKCNPDIIFTDICMPSMDGIEFSKCVVEKYPNIKIIIITGYDEFEYARQGVKLGVADFILKPINSEELMDTLIRLKKMICTKKEQEKEYNQLKKYVKECVDNINSMKNQDEEKYNSLIERIKDYLNNNIANTDLCLTTVAKEFYISSGHLGRLFKQETKRTFVEYLTEIRIKKIEKLLIETDFKGAQICERVGISDPHYLSILFKKQTGLSINEFRKYKRM